MARQVGRRFSCGQIEPHVLNVNMVLPSMYTWLGTGKSMMAKAIARDAGMCT